MNIKGIEFQSTNERGGKISKFELAIRRLMLSGRSMVTVHEFAKIAHISVVSAYRYWANINQRYDGCISAQGGWVSTTVDCSRQLLVIEYED